MPLMEAKQTARQPNKPPIAVVMEKTVLTILKELMIAREVSTKPMRLKDSQSSPMMVEAMALPRFLAISLTLHCVEPE
jgi:hypothetical protein